MMETLQGLAAGAFARTANLHFYLDRTESEEGGAEESGVGTLQDTWIEAALRLSGEALMLLCQQLHFRVLKRLLACGRGAQFDQELIKEIKHRCLALSMQREENLQRTRTDAFKHIAGRVPMIDVLQSSHEFKLRPFAQPHAICLDPRPGRSDVDQPGIFVHTGAKELVVHEEGVVPKEEFEHAFLEIFAEGQLQHLEWSNVIAAGGSVMACLAPVDDEYRLKPFDSQESKAKLRQWFHEEKFETADIDLFIFGLPSEDQFKHKVISMRDQIAKAHPDKEFEVLKTKNSFTIVRGYPYRCIQIMRAMYNCKADVLAHFDLDCVAVGYDGKSVVCLPRFRRAFRSKTNVFNGQLSLTSNTRTEKYNLRGFAFALPRFTTVDVGSKHLRIHQREMLLALGKMNLLHSNHITFNEDTNLRNWFGREWPWGCCVPGAKFRAIVVAEDRDCQFKLHRKRGGGWPNSTESEGSCNLYYFVYDRNATLDNINLWKIGLSFDLTPSKPAKPKEKAKGKGKAGGKKKSKAKAKGGQGGKSAADSPAWFGAPPTSDWEIVDPSEGKSTRQLVSLRYAVHVLEIVLDLNDGSLMEGKDGKRLEVTDSGGRAWIVHLKQKPNSGGGWRNRSAMVLAITLEYVKDPARAKAVAEAEVEESSNQTEEDNSKKEKIAKKNSSEESHSSSETDSEEEADKWEEKERAKADMEEALCSANVLIGCTPSSWPLLRELKDEEERKARSRQMLWLDFTAIFTETNTVSGEAEMWLDHFRPPANSKSGGKRKQKEGSKLVADEIRLAFTIQTLSY